MVLCLKYSKVKTFHGALHCDLFTMASLLDNTLNQHFTCCLETLALGLLSILLSARTASGVLAAGELWSCVSLKTLNLSYNNLPQLPYQLHVCGQLETLNVAHNKLIEFIRPWHCPLVRTVIDNNISFPLLLLLFVWSIE